MMVEKEDLGLSLSLNFFHNTPKPHPHPHPLNLISSSIQTFTSSGILQIHTSFCFLFLKPNNLDYCQLS